MTKRNDKFEDIKKDVIDSWEFMLSEQQNDYPDDDDSYYTDTIVELKLATDFFDIAEILVHRGFWEISDAIESGWHLEALDPEDEKNKKAV